MKFGDAVRPKTEVAMKNGALAKMVRHNIVCTIHGLCDARLEPQFWGQQVPA